MRKKLFTFLLALAASVGLSWATDPIVIPTNTEQSSYTQGDITITCSKPGDFSGFYLDKSENETATITNSGSSTISQIVLGIGWFPDDRSYVRANGAEPTTSSDPYSITFSNVNSNNVTLTITNGKIQISDVTITLADEGGSASSGDKLSGAFSVSGTKVVYFSQGNLQATTADNGSTWTWGFAEHQYDFIGDAVANNAINGGGTVSSNGAVDLFGWSSDDNNYFGIDNSAEFTDYDGNFQDWGAKMGSDWRTLTYDEWEYLLLTREPGSLAGSTSNPRFTRATILTDGTAPSQDIFGLILFPDDFNDGNNYIEGVTWNGINSHSSYVSPTFCTTAGWATLESMGCVFLPAPGWRSGDAVTNVGAFGIYWASTKCTETTEDANCMYFSNTDVSVFRSYFSTGASVRLVSETAPGGSASSVNAARFVYNYDCQRSPAFPKVNNACTLSGFKDPYEGYKGYNNGNIAVGPWKLEFVAYYTPSNSYGCEARVTSAVNQYFMTLSNEEKAAKKLEVPIFRLWQYNLTEREYQPATYGIVCAYAGEANAQDHAALFISSNNMGCFLSGHQHTTSFALTCENDLTTGLDALVDAASASDPELDAIQPIIVSIDAIGTVKLSDYCKYLIEGSRAAYNALTDEQKAQITNYNTLVAAEAQWAALVTESQPYANAVIGLINAIPNPVVYTQDCKDAIDAAQAAYDALTDNQKYLVTNTETLLQAPTAFVSAAPYVNIIFTADNSNVKRIENVTLPKVFTSGDYSSEIVAIIKELYDIDEEYMMYWYNSSDRNAVEPNSTTWTVNPFVGTVTVNGALRKADYTSKSFNVDITLELPPFGPTPTPSGDKLSGAFSVSGTKVVYFSKGNLQATTNDQGATWTWGFAENQWDYVGDNAANTSFDYYGGTGNGSYDLFGWIGASSALTDYRQYGIGSNYDFTDYGNTAGEDLKADWGSLMGSDWRTLTYDEWQYLIKNRNNAANLLAYATVNGKTGLILLPDSWTSSSVALTITTANYTTNIISASDWSTLEEQGCVFLPAAGSREDTSVSGVGEGGDYWSSSSPSGKQYDEGSAYCFFFDTDFSKQADGMHFNKRGRGYGLSVRLVSETAPSGGSTPAVDPAVQNVIDLINAIPNPVVYNQECFNALNAVYDAYVALSEEQRDQVTNYDDYLAAQERYYMLASVNYVIEKINEIGDVEFTSACKHKIDYARSEYCNLTLEEKGYVTNYNTLLAAEAAYAALIPVSSTVVWDEAILATIDVDEWGEATYTNGSISLKAVDGRAYYVDDEQHFLFDGSNSEKSFVFSCTSANMLCIEITVSEKHEHNELSCAWQETATGYRWVGEATSVDLASTIFKVTGIRFSLGEAFPEPTPTPAQEGDKLPGAFSVGGETIVYFSKGNLQYLGNIDRWHFAENQWTIIGNSQASNNRDLFSWGTGDNPDSEDYSTYTEWGNNIEGNWRTLTVDEWTYLFNTRTDASSKYGTATVAGVVGLILLPDNYDGTAISTERTAWDNNVISGSEWAVYEAAGAVFLPAAGLSDAYGVYGVGEQGFYWSSTMDALSYDANAVFFGFNYWEGYWFNQVDAPFQPQQRNSVRLVSETAPSGGSTPANPVIKLNANFGGTYDWADTEAFTDNGDGTATLSNIALTAGYYYNFSVNVGDEWFSINHEFTRENPSCVISNGEGIYYFQADVTGDYSFTWEYTTNTLTIGYPAIAPTPSVPAVGMKGSWDDWADVVNFTDNGNGTASVAKSFEHEGYYTFKTVVDGDYRGVNTTLKRDYTGEADITTNSADINLWIDAKGEYTFTWTYASNAINITYPTLPTAQFKGSWDGWSAADNFVEAADHLSASFTKNFTAEQVGYYQFKMNIGTDDWRGNGETFNRSYTGAQWINGDNGNMYLYVDEPGDYTFTWNFTANALSIVFPAATDKNIPTNTDLENPNYHYSTFYDSANKFALTNDGTEAFVADLSGTDLVLTKIAGGYDVIPANTAVIFRKNSPTNEPVVLTPSDAEPVVVTANNDLRGVDVQREVEGAIEGLTTENCYVLSGPEGVGFYRISGTLLKAHKAFVKYVSSSANPAPRRMRFVFDTATGVENVQGDNVQSTKVLENGVLYIIRNGAKYNVNGQLIK